MDRRKLMSTFVVLRTAALGNRIKSYASHMARYDRVLIEKPTDINLFENFELATPEDIQNYPHTGSVWRLLVDENEEHLIDELKSIDFLYGKVPQYFVDKYVPIFKQFKLKSDLQKVIDDITKDWDKENMVGINIRSWLPPIDNCGRSVWVDFEGFEREVQKLESNQKFFFSSDNLNINNYYKEKYPNQIITLPRTVSTIANDGSVDDVQQTKEAFLEMYLLSQCQKKIVCSFGSTFPEVAWWFGGCKAEVVTPTFWDKVPESFYNDVFIQK
jgi:hypothetical protein